MEHTPNTLTALVITLAVIFALSVLAYILRERTKSDPYRTARSAPSPNDLADPHRVEPGMTEAKFWELIEHSWGAGATQLRHDLLSPDIAAEAARELVNMSEFMLMSLEESLYLLSQADLTEFGRILKAKLVELNCPEAREHIGQNQHPYGNACSFVVAAGKEVFTAVSIDPTVWTVSESLNEFSLIPERVFAARFDRPIGAGRS